MKVRFTPQARAQLLSALDYIRSDNPTAARQFRKKVETGLVRYPNSGRRVPEFPDLPFREVMVAPYRFFYRKEGTTVWVVAVWHGAQQPHEP